MGKFITVEEAKKITIESAIEKINDTIKKKCERGCTSCLVSDVFDLPTEAVNSIFKQLKECGYTLYPEVIGYTQVVLGITWQDNWNRQEHLVNRREQLKELPFSYELLLKCYEKFDFYNTIFQESSGIEET